MKKSVITAGLVCASVLWAGGDIEEPSGVPESMTGETAAAFSGYNADLKFGTLGVGVDVARAINDRFALRLNVNGLRYSRQETIDDVDYDGTISLLTVGGLVDYHPFTNAFRISAGAYYNGNKFSGTATPSATQTLNIGNNTYTGAEIGRLDAQVDFNKFAPYLGIGWGSDARQEGWGFSFDLGVMYQGSPQVDATAAINASLPAAVKQAILDDIEVEKQNIQDDVKNYKWYPVIMIGVNYTF